MQQQRETRGDRKCIRNATSSAISEMSRQLINVPANAETSLSRRQNGTYIMMLHSISRRTLPHCSEINGNENEWPEILMG